MRHLDYSRKRYANNPLFKKSLMRRKPSLVRKLAWGIMSGLAAFGLFWAIFLSGFFAVREISVTGNERVPEWEIVDEIEARLEGRSWFVIPKNNILLLSEDDLAAALSERFVLESVEVTKRPPGRLDMVVKERVSSILLRLSDGTKAVLGLDGGVLRVYRPDESYAPAPGETVHTLIDDRDKPADIGTQVISPTIVQAVIDAPEAVRAAFADIEVAELHIEAQASRTLHIVTNEGWGIYVDAFEDMSAQLANAAIVLRTKVAADRPRLDYIDARFGERVFFKLK